MCRNSERKGEERERKSLVTTGHADNEEEERRVEQRMWVSRNYTNDLRHYKINEAAADTIAQTRVTPIIPLWVE